MFRPGRDLVHVAGQFFDGRESAALADVAMDEPLQLTAGDRHALFEFRLAQRFEVRHAIAVNSGSSANLLAFAALALAPGSRVITPACAFPTTVAPIVQFGCVPVFVDVLPDGNVDPAALEDGLATRGEAIVLAHALGFPFDVGRVQELADRYDLPILADCCDAAGAAWDGNQVTQLATVSTLSFYPAHHLTTGEGGAVLTNDDEIAAVVRSLRDWGRDCTCAPGRDNTCGQRFEHQVGTLPFGYDHKYIYARLGYSLRMTEPQAAIGLVQLSKLDGFIRRRRDTWNFYRDRLADLSPFLDLPAWPRGRAEPSPFGFLVRVRPESPLTRRDFELRFHARRIQTRPLFAGNLTRHPALDGVRFDVPSPLTMADDLMERAFWVGVYPGVTDEMREFVVESFHREYAP